LGALQTPNGDHHEAQLVEAIMEEHDHALEVDGPNDSEPKEMLPFDYQQSTGHVEVDQVQVNEHVHVHYDKQSTQWK
jgi:hypothetical protein